MQRSAKHNDQVIEKDAIDLSVVIPVFNASSTLPELIPAIYSATQKEGLRIEIIAVNDNSTDSSLRILKELQSNFPQLNYIDLLQNYGQAKSTMFGIREAKGKYIATIDDDLQYRPQDLLLLYHTISQNRFEMVCGSPQKKQHKGIYRRVSNLLSPILQRIFLPKLKGVQINSSFKIYRRELFFNEDGSPTSYHIFHFWKHQKGSCASVIVPHMPRKKGRSGYNLRKYYEHFKIPVNYMMRQTSLFLALIFIAWLALDYSFKKVFSIPLSLSCLLFFFICVISHFTLRRESIISWPIEKNEHTTTSSN